MEALFLFFHYLLDSAPVARGTSLYRYGRREKTRARCAAFPVYTKRSRLERILITGPAVPQIIDSPS